MCGIFAYIGNKDDSAQIVFNALKQLEYRGYDSWGVAVVPNSNKKIAIKKKIGKIGQANVNYLPQGSVAFGHTRWATHGGVTNNNAHPHSDCTGSLAVIHNGIFENYEEIKTKLIANGHIFVSQTDSEVIAHLIEERLKTADFKAAVKSAFKSMKGLNAIIAINKDERQIVAAKIGSPLVLGMGHGENYISSDASSLLEHTRDVHFMDDNEIAILDEKKVFLADLKSGKNIKMQTTRLNWQTEQIGKGVYPHFMIKEINEQPEVIGRIAESYGKQAKIIAEKIKTSEKVLFSGCGTAFNAALAGRYMFAKIANQEVEAIVASELKYFNNFLDNKSTALFFSQSGETIDVIEAADELKKHGVSIGAVTNRLGSSLYRMADYKVLLNAGPEICVLSTKSFTAKLAVLLMSSYATANKLTTGKKQLKKTVKNISEILTEEYYQKYLKPVVKKLKNQSHGFVIGRGLSYPAASEAALKLKEVTYIHFEAFAGGELKHGVIALIEKGTPCIVFAPNDESYVETISNAVEIKSRGGFIIGISHKPNSAFDITLPIADVGEASIIPASIVAQLIAYHMAVSLKLDPDKPRNLAKSVTVK